MRYVVGYTANARGGDAVNVAVAPARRQGATANRLLRALPVPMVVVPRDFEFTIDEVRA